jgi:hypothetical protein
VVQLKPPKKEGTDVPVPDGRHEKRSMIYEKTMAIAIYVDLP